MFQSWTQVVDGSPYITDDGEVLQTLLGLGVRGGGRWGEDRYVRVELI